MVTKTMVTIWPEDVLSRFLFIFCPFYVLWVLSFSVRSCSTFLFLVPSLSVFLQTIWPDGKKHVRFKRFSLFSHPCSFAGEVNNAR